MIGALDDVASRSAPKEMAKDWTTARNSWRALSMIDDAVRARQGGGIDVGNIPPGPLYTEAGRDPETLRLAEIGNRHLSDKTPGDGADKQHMFRDNFGLGGSGAALGLDPLTIAAVTLGGFGTDRLLNNPATRRLLAASYANPSDPVVTRSLVGAWRRSERCRTGSRHMTRGHHG
jgi:hypothetical protein